MSRMLTDEENVAIVLAWGTRPGMGSPGDWSEDTPAADKTRMMKECFGCAHRRNLAGESHIACASPDEQMRMDPHGITKGWAAYPLLFDPTWKRRLCRFYQPTTRGQEAE